MKNNKKIPHALLMAAGCAVMLAVIFTLASTTTGSNWGLYVLLLLCPAMHLLMHRGTHRGENQHESPPKQLPIPKSELSANERTKPLK